MKSTSILVEFEVNELDANYEVIGTSDNYSFQYKLGIGSDLVDYAGEKTSKLIPLYGNYGIFEIKVFAVSDIGVRSDFIIGEVVINPPKFDGTFTFNNLRISSEQNTAQDTLEVVYSPSSPSDELIVSQQFYGKSMNISWELIPPVGHALEGESVSSELLSDSFFSGIIINIKNEDELVDLTSIDQDNIALQSLALDLNTDPSSVVDDLNNFRNFSINLDENVFDGLDLSRSVSLELIAVDKFGQTCTGTISGYNPAPFLNNAIFSLNGFSAGMSWESDQEDISGVEINYLGIPKEVELFNSGSIQESKNFLDKASTTLNRNVNWYNGFNYSSGDLVLRNGNVYRSDLDHLSSVENSPENNNEIWINWGNNFEYIYSQDITNQRYNSFKNSQLFGYKYYYSLQPFDAFGSGDLYYVSEGQEILPYNPLDEEPILLEPIFKEIKIDNLRFSEKKDSLVFNWDILDEDDNIVDLVQYKSLLADGAGPAILGVSGSLYDLNTKQTVNIITEGETSKSLERKEEGGFEEKYVTASKVFDTFEYTREINNNIYTTLGFPDNVNVFDATENYQVNDYVVDENQDIFKAILDTNVDFPKIKPSYKYWEEDKDYLAGECFIYNQKIYKVLENFGPTYTLGLFDFSTNYNAGDLVVSPSVDYEAYDSNNEYIVDQVVLYNNTIYICIESQESGFGGTPNTNKEKWRVASLFFDIPAKIFKAINPYVGIIPIFGDNGNEWEVCYPSNSIKVEEYIDYYLSDVDVWSDEGDFFAGDLVLYNNDIWSGILDNGISSDNIQVPQNGSYWTNTSNGDDIVFEYPEGKLVYYGGAVYKASQENPVGIPLFATNNNLATSHSTYEGTQWIPYWQLEDQYADVVFGHKSIPEGGKRSIGLELGLVNSDGEVYSVKKIEADNPAPYILTEGFKENVDSISEVTKVRFNFNYALDFQEKVTQVYLYRSDDINFDITGSNGLPYDKVMSKINGSVDLSLGSSQVVGSDTLFLSELQQGSVIKIENQKFTVDDIVSDTVLNLTSSSSEDIVAGTLYKNADSTLAKITLGAENATFGDNINVIIDSPPVYDEPTGYYYKILPFDDFGSGVLFNVPNGPGGLLEKVNIIPKNFSDKDPYSAPGRVVRADPTVSTDAIPGYVDLRGESSFESFFLKWNAPTADFDPETNNLLSWTENDIEYYEVWESEEPYIKSGNSDSIWTQSDNTGYRRIEGTIYSIGQEITTVNDPARNISNAENIFNVPANSPSIEVVHSGETNHTKYFWVRSVDKAGNKSPFSDMDDQSEGIQGLSLTPGPASATNIDGFESSITNKFYNTIALSPNNPFDDIQNGWSDHSLYHTGQEYNISANSDGLENGYIWWQTGNSYYNTGAVHPATTKETDPNFTDFNDGDFIIARVTDGNATPVFHAFANALIGTANIAEASIIDAQIKDLRADKITAGEINSADIELTSFNDQAGVIRSKGFDGISSDPNRSGFYLSGDGTFAFQAGDSSLSFEDDRLTLVGNIKQSDTKDYDFVDINVVPEYFNYIESEQGLVLLDDSKIDIEVYFRNSSLTDQDSDKIYFKLDAIVGDESYSVFDYGQLSEGGVSGFQYHTFEKKEDGSVLVKATLSGGFLDSEEGFHDIITNPVPGITGDAVVLRVSGANSTYERSATISRVIDGKLGEMGVSPTFQGVYDSLNSYYYIPGNDQKPSRGDIVKWSSNSPNPQTTPGDDDYYICTRSHGPEILGDSDYKLPDNNDYWKPFGASFKSVATEILLTEEAFITEKLTMGANDGPTDNPHSGIIVSNGFVGGLYNTYNPESITYTKKINCAYYDVDFGENDGLLLGGADVTPEQRQKWNDDSIELNSNQYESLLPIHTFRRRGSSNIMELGRDQFELKDLEFYETGGFLLGKLSDTRAVFDIGGTGSLGNNSYIRFDSEKGKIEIQGAFTNNTILDSSFDLNQLENIEDQFATFVGGGYNNLISDGLDGLGSAIVGGAYNINDSRFSVVCGGFSGECRDNFSFIGAGYENSMPLEEAGDHQGANFIGAGIENTISGGACQTVLNGVKNQINQSEGANLSAEKIIIDPDQGLFGANFLGDDQNAELYLSDGSLFATKVVFPCKENVLLWVGEEYGYWTNYLYVGHTEGLKSSWVYYPINSKASEFGWFWLDPPSSYSNNSNFDGSGWVYSAEYGWIYWVPKTGSQDNPVDQVLNFIHGDTSTWYAVRMNREEGEVVAEITNLSIIPAGEEWVDWALTANWVEWGNPLPLN